MRLRRLLPLLLVGALAALTFTSPTRAAGLPPLVVHRTEDTAGCPDARALATLVAEQMKRPALAPAGEVSLGPDRGLDVQMYRSDQGFTAVIQAGGKTRQLSDKGPSCGGLTAALAVSIAVMLDTEPLPPEPEPPPSPTPPTEPLPTEPAPPAPSPPASASALTPAPAPPVDDRLTEVHRFHVSLAVSPVITDGVLRPAAAGITSELEVRFGRFSVSGGVFALPGQTITFAPGQVTLSVTSGFLRGCGALVGDGDSLRLSLCVEPYAGVIRGVGQGYHVDHTLSLPWAAAGASAAFQQRIVGPLSWGARAGLLIPLLKQSFVVDNVGTAFTPAPVGGALDVGLRVSIW